MSNDNNNQKNPLDAASSTASELNEINTTADSNAQFVEEDIEAISSPTDIPYPINFRQYGQPTISKGEITFNYVWDCNVEMKLLKGTIVGERVTYPGGDPYKFPTPPFDEAFHNPTITGVDGAEACLSDTHHVPRFLFFPAFIEANIDATQLYTFRAPSWMQEGQYNKISGPFTINRKVYKSGGEGWMYSCSKNGVTATLFALDAPTQPPPTKQSINPNEEIEKISTIKVDSTRGDLLELFRAPSGISNPFSASFQYRECLNLFVDVVLEREYDENGQLIIGLSNRIISISAPYLKSTSIA